MTSVATTSVCKHCAVNFTTSSRELAFLRKATIPAPSLCPSCRQERRLAHWPFGILQKRQCDFSGEPIITTYPPNARFPIYKRDYWYSDDWSPPKQDIDWQRPFLEQLLELQSKTPHVHTYASNVVNCDFADDTYDSKNVYMSRSCANSEDLYYIYRVLGSKDSMDLTYCYDLEAAYECTYCFESYNLKYSVDCHHCSDSYFLYDCRGTRDSFMCWNLRNKQYHILNQPFTKAAYHKQLQSFDLESRKNLMNFQEEFQSSIKAEALHKACHIVNSENAIGNYITNCKDCLNVFFLEDSRDCMNITRGAQNVDCLDCVGSLRGELCYETTQCTDLYNVQFANYCLECSNSQYVDQCVNCNDVFGCVGLKRGRYQILNKQYTRDEYEALRPKLIEHMQQHGEYGEFFPYGFAYSGFNLSLAAFNYDETEESIKQKGGFFEQLPATSQGDLLAEQLPDQASDITDDFLGQAIVCARTENVYSFIQQELDFYRRHNLPLPIYYPEARNLARCRHLTPLRPQQVHCCDCHESVTNYFPKEWRYKKIACNACYLEQVY
ncbi:hypothetical protein OAO01_00270 [Oligoflexia bacterium]|nr:hypothetical protein [Oligoflexia bacterium]